MTPEITRLHHVGHVVQDMTSALALYRRLGFVVPPPSIPAMPSQAGRELTPFGAANTHADFAHDFVELATVVRDGDSAPPDAQLVPLQAPADVLPTLLDRINTTSANLAACLERFEGLHILLFSSADIDATADRLTASDVQHGGVNTLHRPAGAEVETVRYLEIDGVRPGVQAEGRIGVSAELDPRIQVTRSLDHPNGAVGLADVTLCAADDELPTVTRRYQRYLNHAPRTHGPARVFDLHESTLTLVPESALDTLLPGAASSALPALVGTTLAVRDLTATRALLRNHEVPTHTNPAGDLVVPAGSALGAAIAFRQRVHPGSMSTAGR